MHTIDFTTALGRLLRDGAVRDSFRASASNVADQFELHADARPAFLALSPSELDVQADVLLRKRLDCVKRLAPELCASLAGTLWPRFREYAREQWHDDWTHDALHFYGHVSRNDAGFNSRAEYNRLQFLASTAKIRIHLVRTLHRGDCARRGMQILVRGRTGGLRETWLYLAF